MKIRTPLTLALLLAASAAAAGGGHEHGDAPTVSVTRWTERMELFMEHPALVSGHTEEFIVHLTVLDGFRPVRGGRLTLRFTDAQGAVQEFASDAPLREGIFTAEVGLRAAGDYALEIAYAGDGPAEVFGVPAVTVHDGHVHADEAGHDAETITFLKEQQWKVPFATADAVERDVKRAVWAVGEVLPAPAAFAEVVAPVDGVLAAGAELALPGARVEAGQVLARLVPTLQGGGWTEARLAYAQAERNYDRARRLHAGEAISDRELEEARNEYLARKAGHDNLAADTDGEVLSVTSPLAGVVLDWRLSPGQRLQAGDRLMSVADPSVVWLRVNVYERDFAGLGTPVGARVGSGPDGWTVPADALRVLSTGGALDPATRTFPVLLEVANDAGRLAINETAPVELYAGDGRRALTVPRSAVHEQAGLDVVYVQTGGETFVQRTVTVGPRFADWITVASGLEPGDRVVVRGGYHVKLASTTAEIGHGHAH